MAETSKQVHGWKEIAAHLEVAESTARLLLAEELPVRRLRSSVFAFIDELDAWKRARPRVSAAA